MKKHIALLLAGTLLFWGFGHQQDLRAEEKEACRKAKMRYAAG